MLMRTGAEYKHFHCSTRKCISHKKMQKYLSDINITIITNLTQKNKPNKRIPKRLDKIQSKSIHGNSSFHRFCLLTLNLNSISKY